MRMQFSNKDPPFHGKSAAARSDCVMLMDYPQLCQKLLLFMAVIISHTIFLTLLPSSAHIRAKNMKNSTQHKIMARITIIICQYYYFETEYHLLRFRMVAISDDNLQ
jgi:hypothetical protein